MDVDERRIIALKQAAKIHVSERTDANRADAARDIADAAEVLDAFLRKVEE
jgi:hypothetical protein